MQVANSYVDECSFPIPKRQRTQAGSFDIPYSSELIDVLLPPSQSRTSWDALMFGLEESALSRRLSLGSFLVPEPKMQQELVKPVMTFADMENFLIPSARKRKSMCLENSNTTSFDDDATKCYSSITLNDVYIPQTTPSSAPSTSPCDNSISFFHLLEEPKEIQRKSYINENRYLLPNPLVVQIKNEYKHRFDNTPAVVSVELVNVDGFPLQEKKATLHGTQSQEMNHLRAQFQLKILDTAEGTKFRLLFTVNYLFNGQKYEEKILSKPFMIYSNKKKTVKPVPIISDIEPKSTSSSKETQVWIRGRNFAKNVLVYFGDKVGRVLSVQKDLITVMVPPRNDLQFTTLVPIKVLNKYSKISVESRENWSFEYIPTPQTTLPINTPVY